MLIFLKMRYTNRQINLMFFSLIVMMLAAHEVYREIKYQLEIKRILPYSARIDSIPQSQNEFIIQMMMRDFESAAARRGIKVDLSQVSFSLRNEVDKDPGVMELFSMDELTTLGSCSFLQKHMYFREDTIYADNLATLRATVYHELAHCLFYMEHDESAQDFPVIMNAVKDVDWEFVFFQGKGHQWDSSVDHLFSQRENINWWRKLIVKYL